MLLADRHHASREVLAGWLRSWGAEVTCADDDGTLGPLLKERRWGLVLIDGESLESVRSELAVVARRGVPVLDLTLATDSSKAAAQGGALAKPLRRPTVAAVLAAALTRATAVNRPTGASQGSTAEGTARGSRPEGARRRRQRWSTSASCSSCWSAAAAKWC